METVIIQLINCNFHLLYCAKCNSLYHVSVLTDDCNLIKFQRSITSVFKYNYNNSPFNHSHKDVFLRTNLYIETFEDTMKYNYDMFLSVTLSRFPPTSVLLDELINAKMQLQIYYILLVHITIYSDHFVVHCFLLLLRYFSL